MRFERSTNGAMSTCTKPTFVPCSRLHVGVRFVYAVSRERRPRPGRRVRCSRRRRSITIRCLFCVEGGETPMIPVRDMPSMLHVETFDQVIVTMRQLHRRSHCSNPLGVLQSLIHEFRKDHLAYGDSRMELYQRRCFDLLTCESQKW